MASPIGPELAQPSSAMPPSPPPPPSGGYRPGYAMGGLTGPTAVPPSSPLAAWALTLAISGAVLSLIGWVTIMGSILLQLEHKLGPNPTEEQARKVYIDMMASGQAVVITPLGAVVFIVGIVCGACALVLAIRSLLRQEHRRGVAIAACIISVCFTFCQIMPMLATWTMPHAK